MKRSVKKLFQYWTGGNPYIAAGRLLEHEYSLLASRYPDKGSAVYALKHYVKTGRAYYDWAVAFCKANPDKLVAYMVKNSDGCVHSLLEAAKKYLCRYCGLKLVDTSL